MKEIILTNTEKSNLENELKDSKSYRKKQFKNLLLSIIIGNSIAGIVVFLNNGSRNGIKAKLMRTNMTL